MKPFWKEHWALVLVFAFSLYAIGIGHCNQKRCNEKWPNSRLEGNLFHPVCVAGIELGKP